MRLSLQFDSAVNDLAEKGYAVCNDYFDQNLLHEVFNYLKAQQVKNAFQKALIGNGQKKVLAQEVRGDEIYWLNKDRDVKLSKLFDLYDTLVDSLRNALRISINDFEFHFAHYPIGTYYKKHVDTFQTDSSRMLSVVLYLNEGWAEEDGGQIVLYPETGEKLVVQPEMGTMVIFNSLKVPHEVLPTNKSRYSLTGWLLNKTSLF